MMSRLFIAERRRGEGTKKYYRRIIQVILLCSLSPSGPWVEMTQSAAPQRRISLSWITDPADASKVIVEVSGLSVSALRKLRRSNWEAPQWRRLLSVYVVQADAAVDSGLPPMLGSYQVRSDALRFEPQFPLEAGITYRAVFRPERLPGQGVSGSAPITAVFQAPARSRLPTTTVSRIYPMAETLPENLLKFYLYFSAPMSRGRIYDHIHLLGSSGQKIELPFLEIDEELWDPTMTRLTLFIDPGRIKREVLPLEEIGPALEAGKSYTLVIDREWRDGAGNPLKENFQKFFRVGPPDRDPPDPAQWKIQPPRSGAREPLTVTFPEPMDHALAQRVIRLIGDTGEAVDGQIALEDQERRWTFTPITPWRPGGYKLVIQTTIEDLAGNNIGKPFEVDLFEGVERRFSTPTVKLPFEIH
jgi:hypothetical protein